jgi:hypothetical protein
MSVSFIAAYSLPPMSSRRQLKRNGPSGATWLDEPQMAISRYIGSTAIS